MDGLVDLSDAEHAALASLTDEEARKLFARKDCLTAAKERAREIVAAQKAKKARQSSSDDAQSRRDERKPAAVAGRTAAAPHRPSTQRLGTYLTTTSLLDGRRVRRPQTLIYLSKS